MALKWVNHIRQNCHGFIDILKRMLQNFEEKNTAPETNLILLKRVIVERKIIQAVVHNLLATTSNY